MMLKLLDGESENRAYFIDFEMIYRYISMSISYAWRMN